MFFAAAAAAAACDTVVTDDWMPSEQTMIAFSAVLDSSSERYPLDAAIRASAAATPAIDAALDRCLWPETGAALEAAAGKEEEQQEDSVASLLWRVHQAYHTGGRRALLTLARIERRPGLAAYMDRARRRCGCAAADWWGTGEQEEEQEVEEEQVEETMLLPEWVVAVKK